MKHHLIRSHYEKRVARDRESFDILDWGSRESQLARFEVFLRVLEQRHLVSPHSGPHLTLDIGCGLTDLCTFLEEKNIPLRYTGVDIVPGILAEARRRYPKRAVLLADIFHSEPFRPRTFHTAFCSGTLNLEVGNNQTFVATALSAMLPLVKQCLIVNCLHARATQRYKHCHYYEPNEIIEAVPATTARVELIDDYLENDFTLVLWQDSGMS